MSSATNFLLSSITAVPNPISSFLKLLGLLIVLRFLIWIGWRSILYPKYFSPLRSLPGPSGGSFLMGQFFENGKRHPAESVRKWVREVENDGIICFLGMFNAERIIPVSPAALADVLVHKNYHFKKPDILRVEGGRILGIGLFLAEDDEHKRQRKALLPAFAFRHIKDLYPTFWAKSKALVKEVAAQTGTLSSGTGQNAGIEVQSWSSRATLDIIGAAGLGEDFGALEDPTNKLNQTYRILFRPTEPGPIIRILVNFVPKWVFRLPLKRILEIKNAVAFIRDTCLSVIKSKKLSMEKGTLDKDILSVALASGSFSDSNMVDQMMTFLAAGHETTASALTWAIYLLSQDHTVQTRLREEVRNNLPNPLDAEDARVVSAADIEKLPYLNAICQEVFRLYPPVAITIREAAIDTSILDIPIPKGTQIMISPLAVNTDKALWGPDADKFKPDRWLKSSSGGADSNYAFMTFLHGPRSCIGMGFARAEFACLVAAWVGAFETELAVKEAKIELVGRMLLKPRNGLCVNVKRVEW